MIVDFETKSKADIKKVGLYKYATDPSTDIFCLAYGDKIWRNGIDPDPIDLFEHILAGGEMHAFNAAFESAIWQYIMVAKYDWPEVDREKWFCTAARCAVLGLPKKLENVGEFLNLSQVKDSKGHRVMMKLSKPDKKTGELVTPSRDELESLFSYCLQDVRSEEAIEQVTAPLTKRERSIYLYDQKVNQRGIYVDVELARSASAVWAKHLHNLNEEIAEVSKGELNSVNQAVAINRWMGKRGLGMPSLSADAVDEVLKQELPDDIRRVLEIRRDGGCISVNKYVSMLNAVQPDGRIRGCHAYHSASTGRWGGRIFQPQNLPRGHVEEAMIEPLISVVKGRDLDTLRMLYNNVGEALGSLVRPTIMAPPGKKLIVADFSQIEARGVAWVAGEDKMLDAFRNREDVYKIQASDIYKKPVDQITKDERFFGKVCVLGSGYGLGAKGFQAQCLGYGVDVSEEFAAKVIKAYRNSNQYTVALWKLLENAAIACVKNGGTRKVPGGKIQFYMDGHFLKMQLPSGRDLAYYHPKIREGSYGSQLYFVGVGANDKARSESTYGGKLVENLVQAICRDLLVESLARLEKAGYGCVMHVHDEVVLEVDEDFGSKEEVEKIMSEGVKWATGFPIEAVAFETIRYKK